MENISQTLHFPVILDAHTRAGNVKKRVTCPYSLQTNNFKCLFVRVDVMIQI